MSSAVRPPVKVAHPAAPPGPFPADRTDRRCHGSGPQRPGPAPRLLRAIPGSVGPRARGTTTAEDRRWNRHGPPRLNLPGFPPRPSDRRSTRWASWPLPARTCRAPNTAPRGFRPTPASAAHPLDRSAAVLLRTASRHRNGLGDLIPGRPRLFSASSGRSSAIPMASSRPPSRARFGIPPPPAPDCCCRVRACGASGPRPPGPAIFVNHGARARYWARCAAERGHPAVESGVPPQRLGRAHVFHCPPARSEPAGSPPGLPAISPRDSPARPAPGCRGAFEGRFPSGGWLRSPGMPARPGVLPDSIPSPAAARLDRRGRSCLAVRFRRLRRYPLRPPGGSKLDWALDRRRSPWRDPRCPRALVFFTVQRGWANSRDSRCRRPRVGRVRNTPAAVFVMVFAPAAEASSSDAAARKGQKHTATRTVTFPAGFEVDFLHGPHRAAQKVLFEALRSGFREASSARHVTHAGRIEGATNPNYVGGAIHGVRRFLSRCSDGGWPCSNARRLNASQRSDVGWGVGAAVFLWALVPQAVVIVASRLARWGTFGGGHSSFRGGGARKKGKRVMVSALKGPPQRL